MDSKQIVYTVESAVATIRLNRPDRLNAFTPRMKEELVAAFDQADGDDAVRVVTVTGEGQAFCAGADLGAAGATFDYGAVAAESHRDSGGQLALRIFESRKPVIAAINGAAVGIGATMTLPMDIRIASDEARFGFVFTRRGIVPEACSTWFLPRLVGIARAAEWVYSGRVFGAAEALAGGLVSRVVPAAELLPAARALAAEIAAHTSSISVALSRQMLWRMLGASHPREAHRVESRAISRTGSSADAREGVAAFLEKRPARFTLTVTRDLPDVFD
jgi:enoyl-CoA hydratase/carnithine racemase